MKSIKLYSKKKLLTSNKYNGRHLKNMNNFKVVILKAK